MKILVTGGAGYIGSFMTRTLLEKGEEVVVLDSLERGYPQAVDKRAQLIQGNIQDGELLIKIFEKTNFDAIVHFAGYISMAESMEKPEIYFENNVYSSLKLVDLAVRYNIKNFIFSSTAGVYGDPIETPIKENHPKNPTNPYGESKLMVEKLLYWYQKIYGISFASLRYFNAAGAALDGSLGEGHEPETHIIPLAMKAILENKPFSLYGIDYPTHDGTCVRDYVHVIDLVEAHILAFGKISKESGGFFYNVGTGRGHSNREVIEMIEKFSGHKVSIVEEARREGDASELIADPAKIKNELGFVPKYSDLETIVKTAWEWHERNIK